MSRFASSSRRNGTPPLLDILAQAERVARACSPAPAAPTPPPSGPLLDARGRRRSIVTTPGFHRGVAPGNKGKHYKPTPGRAWSYMDMRRRLREVADVAGVRRRVAPHQLRHAWTVHAHADGVDPYTMMLHLRHANLGVTDVYLKGLGIDRAHERVYRQPVPTVPATVLLELARERRAS